jgi:hypothetical protein
MGAVLYSGLVSRVRRMFQRRRVPPGSRFVAGEEFGEEVRIDSLICPLRYDIIVRANFLTYYEQHRDVYAHDFKAFLERPEAEAYFTAWFSDASRSRPHLGYDRVAVQKEYETRVHRAVRLFDSLYSSGFDTRHPIELRSASTIHHEHVKHIRRRLYAGDGCHRLAFLLSQGIKSLVPSQYGVLMFDEFRPRDNTYLLLGKVLRDEAQYCRFISKYYCDGKEIDQPDSILDHVKRNCPSLLEEVSSVMREDLRRLAEDSQECIEDQPMVPISRDRGRWD